MSSDDEQSKKLDVTELLDLDELNKKNQVEADEIRKKMSEGNLSQKNPDSHNFDSEKYKHYGLVGNSFGHAIAKRKGLI